MPVLPDLTDKNAEKVFIFLIQMLFNPWIGGVLLAAIMAAIMSTIDSQLLVSSSALTEDIYKRLFRKNASDKEMMFAGRAIVIIIAVAAFIIASRPECKGLMNLVSCAWGAFGAAFGPVIILSLYWRRLNYYGALSGIIAGFAVDILWYIFLGSTGIYEIVPGFLAGMTVSVIVSLLSEKPADEIISDFEKSLLPTEIED